MAIDDLIKDTGDEDTNVSKEEMEEFALVDPDGRPYDSETIRKLLGEDKKGFMSKKLFYILGKISLFLSFSLGVILMLVVLAFLVDKIMKTAALLF